MLLWFAIVAPIVVAEVFRSPMLDYRLVALGALLPLIDLVWGHPSPLHSLAAPVVVLAVVMALTVNRRLLRRRLLGVPIGMFMHLVLGGAWASAALFWWPVFGWSLSQQPLPESSGIGWRLLLEVLALTLGFWAFGRYHLNDPEARKRLVTTGHLVRGALGS